MLLGYMLAKQPAQYATHKADDQLQLLNQTQQPLVAFCQYCARNAHWQAFAVCPW
jgi:hypothetical protein